MSFHFSTLKSRRFGINNCSVGTSFTCRIRLLTGPYSALGHHPLYTTLPSSSCTCLPLKILSYFLYFHSKLDKLPSLSRYTIASPSTLSINFPPGKIGFHVSGFPAQLLANLIGPEKRLSLTDFAGSLVGLAADRNLESQGPVRLDFHVDVGPAAVGADRPFAVCVIRARGPAVRLE